MTAASGAERAMSTAVAPEDLARADVYALLSSLFYAPPSDAVLALLRAGETDGGEPQSAFSAARAELARATSSRPAGELRAEFESLFWGVGRPRVMPYASFFLTGFMHERPLAELRGDLARLGFGRAPGTGETEDHIAALCDVMRLLIASGADLDAQREFFLKHLKPWYAKLAQALAGTDGADFYLIVANLMVAFFDVESESFAIGN